MTPAQLQSLIDVHAYLHGEADPAAPKVSSDPAADLAYLSSL